MRDKNRFHPVPQNRDRITFPNTGREAIERQTQVYLSNGGKIKKIAQGVSGAVQYVGLREKDRMTYARRGGKK